MSLQEIYSMPGHLLRRCQQISIAIFLDECRDYDIRHLEYAVLKAVDALPDVDQITLAGSIAIDRTSIGRIVGRLERKQYITRYKRKDDARVNCVRISRKGKALLQELDPIVQRVEQRIVEPLTSAQRIQFMEILETICEFNNGLGRAPNRPR